MPQSKNRQRPRHERALTHLAAAGLALTITRLGRAQAPKSPEIAAHEDEARRAQPPGSPMVRAAPSSVAPSPNTTLGTEPVAARPSWGPNAGLNVVRVNVPVDVGVTVALGAAWVASELLGSSVHPSSCRWCDRDADGTDHLNGLDASVRSGLRWHDTAAADTLSSVFSFGLAPAAGFGVGALIAWHDDRLAELPADTLVVAQSGVIAIALNQITKLAVARERPDVHARSPSDRDAAQATSDNLSFFSGHATLAFALATSAGTVASMQHHRLAPVMWVTGLSTATVGGYLRIAADRHYASDVLTGAIVGSAVGFLVPYFAHRDTGIHANVAVVPIAGGSAISISGVW